jgi:hypothetical protein
METVAENVPLRRQYSGWSHSLLVLGPPAVGWLASAAFVPFGLYQWWVNYLIAGAVWGLTMPVRNIVRAAFKYITHEFRDASRFSWWDCVKDEAQQQWWDVRREPFGFLGAWLAAIGFHTLFWPVMVYLGAMLKGSVDHG